MKVRDIMSSHVKTVSTNANIQEVSNEMRSLDVGSIPVCDQKDVPVGIITDRDIVIRGISQGVSLNTPVGDIMSLNIISVSPETDVNEAAKIMSQNQIRRLPVVENGKIVGIVALGDLAIRDKHVDEAGSALSSISENSPFTPY
ncbi:cystathionine beta-synthase domain-containing protein [Gottschalkia purinilytica]|uniref:Cystathionine beta-synthase domain-containing protein n=1 Tax=Gottschalkia purinilytica TaxID=1503 RepID=A0A0L0WFF7_GOTPU|nr:CBS domain-containing protein [Gottschalkia purinilytica]KNF10155.1 cystathionine beta-synthase domain-containing protein [Gottschalkia purinilytica]